MRLEFLKNISISQFTLPLVAIIGLLMWLVLPTAHVDAIDLSQHGLWSLLPSQFTQGIIGKSIAITFSALTVYLIAELTNAFVLLRISSRMLSSSMAILLALILCLHSFTPGLVIMTLTVLSFFALFFTYQTSNPVSTFVAFLFLSLSSLLFPKLLLYVPVFWGCTIFLRSFTMRTFMSSLFGVLLPYWFFLCIAICFDGGLQVFLTSVASLIDFSLPLYTSFALTDILILVYVSIFFLAGVVNFVSHSFLDKTRTRIMFMTIITHGAVTLLFILLQPQYFHTLLPLLLIAASLIGGHYIALTYNKISHIYALIMTALYVALIGAQILL